MSANYKKQHYIPQTYLEAWNDSSNKIYVYQKKDNKLFKHSKVDKVLYENDLYTKTVKDTIILKQEDKEKIFNELHQYNIYYKSDKEEKILKTVEEFSTYYVDFDNWIIKRENGLVVSKKPLKDSIEKKRLTDLEEGWKTIENDWATLRSNIEDSIKNKNSITRDKMDAVLEFIVAQKNRTPKALEECTTIIEKVMSPIKESMGDIYEIEKNSLGKLLFKNQISRYQNEDSRSNILIEINQLRKLQMVFFKPIGRKFITSDSPVLKIIDNNFFKGRYNGIYFPISPDLMVALYRGNNSKCMVDKLESNVVRRVNARIKKESLKYYVTNYKQ